MSQAIVTIKQIIDANQLKADDFTNFVLQGGAGSGKTQSLKEIIRYVSSTYPDKKIACITHTNIAVDEIISRVGDQFEISTIHSFLNKLIRNYRKNIKEVIGQIFYLQQPTGPGHDEYKKVYTKYVTKLFSVTGETVPKVTGKREYDKSPGSFDEKLQGDIQALNQIIADIIDVQDDKLIHYNESRFDSLKELSFSHDSLLTISCALCERFALLGKIISDKYDFIFIDEYQDSAPEVIRIFLELLPKNRKTTVGLFGDSMQGIYEDVIGDVQQYVDQGLLRKVEKEDNFRCSQGVINYINILRNDGIEQEVALKNGETADQRIGEVKFFFYSFGAKPGPFSLAEQKATYADALNELIAQSRAQFDHPDTKVLMLTNKSISSEVGFKKLYKLFDDRYTEVKEEIEKELARIQVSELVELCRAYQTKAYNPLIVALKKRGFVIRLVKDKQVLREHFRYLLESGLSMQKALTYAIEKKFIRKSERHMNYLAAREQLLSELEADGNFKLLEGHYNSGSNTRVRLESNHGIVITDEEFNNFHQQLKRKNFAIGFLSDDIPFEEILNYYSYLNEETGYITMHKTKGSGIKNVIVVLDEYLWNRYNFKSIYDGQHDPATRLRNQKLFYVACSRAISNLAVVRLVVDQAEEDMMRDYFSNCEFIQLQ
ncbi:UvrD-helicase domain-containing protein [Pedobacter antarcticus]|uniref:UvrD-helicase domain-containing protein n=1 Tax=Pedobacter antarcticus TaxID=34086 RepID=UPI00088F79D2|nr:UvrD-helicase domain-containing protein [Pedobacter antarcticus]SDL55732.1 DNA helicase-2 / ATP-dependent DNA helicase PcrA [Pedobacter antarcticus]